MELKTNLSEYKNNKAKVGFIDVLIVLGALFFCVVVGFFAFILLKCSELLTFLKTKRPRSIKKSYSFSNSVILPREIYH